MNFHGGDKFVELGGVKIRRMGVEHLARDAGQVFLFDLVFLDEVFQLPAHSFERAGIGAKLPVDVFTGDDLERGARPLEITALVQLLRRVDAEFFLQRSSIPSILCDQVTRVVANFTPGAFDKAPINRLLLRRKARPISWSLLRRFLSWRRAERVNAAQNSSSC